MKFHLFTTLAVAICLSGYLLVDADSTVDFRATPDNYKYLHPEPITLHCGLNETTPTLSLVGRDVTSLRDDVAEDADDVSRTSEAVDVVTGIMIVRSTGETVASISGHNIPRHFFVSSPANVSGNITGSGVTGVKGYLQVVLKDPSEQLKTGEFECGINVMTSSGKGKTLMSSVVVHAQLPTLQDVISQLVKLDHDKTAEIQRLEAEKIAEMTSLRDELTHNITSQSDELRENQQEILNLTQKISQQKQDITHRDQDISNLTQSVHQHQQELTQHSQDIRNLTQEVNQQNQEISEQKQNISTLTQEIAAQAKDMVDQKQEMTQHASQLSSLTHDTSTLTQENVHLRGMINSVNHSLSHQNDLLRASIQSFQHSTDEEIKELHHFETGMMYVRDLQTHPTGVITVTRAFREKYDQPPVVHLSVTKVEGAHSHDDVWYNVALYKATTTDFTFIAHVLPGGHIQMLGVSYIAVPK